MARSWSPRTSATIGVSGCGRAISTGRSKRGFEVTARWCGPLPPGAVSAEVIDDRGTRASLPSSARPAIEVTTSTDEPYDDEIAIARDKLEQIDHRHEPTPDPAARLLSPEPEG
jgi:hypothetical protein